MKIKAISDKNENTFIDSMMKLYEKKRKWLNKKIHNKHIDYKESDSNEDNCTNFTNLKKNLQNSKSFVPPIYQNIIKKNPIHKLAFSPSNSTIIIPSLDLPRDKNKMSLSQEIPKKKNFTKNFIKYIKLILQKNKIKNKKKNSTIHEKLKKKTTNIDFYSEKSITELDKKINSLYETFPIKIKKQIETLIKLKIHIKFFNDVLNDINRKLDIRDSTHNEIDDDRGLQSHLFSKIAECIEEHRKYLSENEFIINQEIDPKIFFKSQTAFPSSLSTSKSTGCLFPFTKLRSPLQQKRDEIEKIIKNSKREEIFRLKQGTLLKTIKKVDLNHEQVDHEVQTSCVNNEKTIDSNNDVNNTSTLFKELSAKNIESQAKNGFDDKSPHLSIYASGTSTINNANAKPDIIVPPKPKKVIKHKKNKKKEKLISEDNFGEPKKTFPINLTQKEEEIQPQEEKPHKIEIKVDLNKQKEIKHTLLQKIDSVEGKKQDENKEPAIDKEAIKELRRKYLEREKKFKRLSKDNLVEQKIIDVKSSEFNIKDFFFQSGTSELRKKKELKVLKLTQELNYLLSQDQYGSDQNLFEEFKEKINSLKKFDNETYLAYLNDNYDFIQNELNTLKLIKQNEREINDFLYHYQSDINQIKLTKELKVPKIKLITFDEEIEYILSENDLNTQKNCLI